MKIKLDNVKGDSNVLKFEEFCLKYQERRDVIDEKKKERREVREYREMKRQKR